MLNYQKMQEEIYQGTLTYIFSDFIFLLLCGKWQMLNATHVRRQKETVCQCLVDGLILKSFLKDELDVYTRVIDNESITYGLKSAFKLSKTCSCLGM